MTVHETNKAKIHVSSAVILDLVVVHYSYVTESVCLYEEAIQTPAGPPNPGFTLAN